MLEFTFVSVLQEPSGSPTPKRPRGRPKGSKNKAGSTAPKGKVSVCVYISRIKKISVNEEKQG